MTGKTAQYRIFGHCDYVGQLAVMLPPLKELGHESYSIDFVLYDVTNDVELDRKPIDSGWTADGPQYIDETGSAVINHKLYNGNTYKAYFELKVEAASTGSVWVLSDFYSSRYGLTMESIEVKPDADLLVGDLNCDGLVSLSEILAMINGWSNDEVNLGDIIKAINNWANS